jgi:nucleoside-diphosphate-sugar epimerase
MATLLCFGFGYTAQHFVDEFGAGYDRIVGTRRTIGPGTSAGLPIEMMAFDGQTASPALLAALRAADAVLTSIPPCNVGDPVLAQLANVWPASRPAAIVYLSTVGVYGDHGGAEVDETTAPRPVSARSAGRLAAEEAWRQHGDRVGAPVAILRLGGIYGPGRNALVNLIEGRARRIIKPGQVFSRIHVADIAQVIDAAIARRAGGVYNVTDDEPAPPQDVIAYAAGLLRRDPPPQIPFAEAAKTMTPMALSFYGENKRVVNRKLKAALGVCLRYPTYRDGIRALYEMGGFAAASPA